MHSNEQVLSDDLPKLDPWKDDRLGFAPFAEKLAKSILSINAPSGYVIGLCGEWGAGKTTIINFTKAYIRHSCETANAPSASFFVIDFKPWLISGHHDLIGAFFKILSESIASRKPRRWRDKAFAFLRRTNYARDPILDAMGKIAVAFDPTGGIVSNAATTITRTSISKTVDSLLSTPSLQSTHDLLRDLLSQETTRFLVVVDDIDRLETDEIRTIVKMLKSVGQLPNVIYLIAYDRSIISSAFATTSQNRESYYLEKIVQQEIDIPSPSQHAIFSVLDSELSFLGGDADDTLRWQYIVRFGIRRWVRHPRDVQRLANAVKFAWPALKDEFDPGDLLAMEAIRLFERPVFNWIRDNRDLLFAEGAFALMRQGEHESAFKSLRDLIPESKQDSILTVLSALFPEHSKSLSGRQSVGQEAVADLIKRRGVGSLSGYETYFQLHPSEDAVPKSLISEIILRIDDESFLSMTFESYLKKNTRTNQPKISLLFEELQPHFEGDVAIHPSQALLDSLFAIGDHAEMYERETEFLSVPPYLQLLHLVNVILRCWGVDHAGKKLSHTFANSHSVMFCSHVFLERTREVGLIDPSSPSQALIDKASIEKIGKSLLALIYRLRDSGRLEEVRFFGKIGLCWKYLGKTNEAREWISGRILENQRFLATISDGIVWHSVSAKGKSYKMKELPDEELYDHKVLLEACRMALSGDKLSDDEKNRISIIAMKLELADENKG